MIGKRIHRTFVVNNTQSFQPNCIKCGRALAGDEDPPNLCPDCRQALLAEIQARGAPPKKITLAHMPLTASIIAVNTLVYLAMDASGVSPFTPTTLELLKWGALSAFQTLTTQPWRIITCNYVHIGLPHIALNMWCLWNLGALAERIFDRRTYFLTYTACGVAGSIVSLWFHPVGVGAGASGAIFGLAGALISALYLGRLPVNPQALKSTLKSLLSFAGYNLFFGTVVPGIDNSAHIGGLVCGLILGSVLARHLTSPHDERSAWRNWVFLLTAICLIGMFYLVRYAILHGGVRHIRHGY